MKSNVIFFILALLLSTTLSLVAQSDSGTTTIIKKVISADGNINEETIVLQGDQMETYLKTIESEHQGEIRVEVEKENEHTVINIIVDESAQLENEDGDKTKKEIKVFKISGEDISDDSEALTVDVKEVNGKKVVTIIKDGMEKVIEVDAGDDSMDKEIKIFKYSSDDDQNNSEGNEVKVDVQEVNGKKIVTIVQDGKERVMEVEAGDEFEIEEDGHKIIVITTDDKKEEEQRPKAFIGIQMEQRIEKENDGAGEVTNASKIQVVSTIPDSPAEKAGVESNDIIKAIDGVELQEIDLLLNHLDGKNVGDQVILTVLRGGVERKIAVVLGERPTGQHFSKKKIQWHEKRGPNGEMSKEEMFMRGMKPNGTARKKSNFIGSYERDPCKPFIGVSTSYKSRDGENGIRINRVVPNTPAERSNLEKGDIILEMDGKNVNTTKTLRAIRDGHKAGDRFKLVILSDGKRKKIRANFDECDTQTELEEIIEIEDDGKNLKNKIDLNIFPNPSSGEVNIAYKGKPGAFSIQVMDVSGKVIASQDMNNFDGSYNTTFDFTDNPAGTLIIQIENEGKQLIEKLILQNVN